MSVAVRCASPPPPRTEEELDEHLSEPRDATVEALRHAPGDIIVLGAGGKMGPTLARMAARAAERSDGSSRRRVIAVSRFTSRDVPRGLAKHGVETIPCDLLDAAAVERLPDAPNVVFMAGQKFGTSDAPSRTWMMNVVVPAHCARRYAGSRVVAFSTGNVYPLTPVDSGERPKTRFPRRSGSTPRRASGASACSSSTPRQRTRASRSCGSTTPSTSATVCSPTWRNVSCEGS